MDELPLVAKGKVYFYGWVAFGAKAKVYVDGWPLVQRQKFMWMGGLWCKGKSLCGWVAEWFKAAVLKTAERESVP